MQNKIVWREGLFIRPQHFQQNDRYYNYELMTRTASLGSNKWGFFDLEIDKNLLGIGKLVLKHASGILKDGTLFEIDSQNDQLSFDITNEHINEDIYLALPILIPNSSEVRFENQENILTRFFAKNLEEVSNSNSGENSQSDVLVSAHNFILLPKSELNSGYISIKIAHINSLSSSGIVVLDKDYIPTYLHLNMMIDLQSKLNELYSVIEFRIEKLALKIAGTSLQASELGNYLMLQVLNKTIARLNFLTTQDKIHPQDLFLELSSLAGELAIFMKKERKLSTQFLYKHEDLGSSFNLVITELKNMLSMVIEQNAILLTIDERKYGINVAQITAKDSLASSTCILAVSANTSAEKIKKALTANLKVGNIENIRNLVNYHLAGYKITTLPTPPSEIPFKVNYLYFNIELNSEAISDLERSGGFAFHLSHELPNIQYELWLVRNSKRELNEQ